MSTQPTDPPRASGPFFMSNHIYVDRPATPGPHGVLGAVGTRVIGRETPSTARGVVTERPAMSDYATSPDAWKADARDALRGIAAMHGCVNRQYTADLVNELIEAACKDGRTPDLNNISAELIRQIEANKESAPMTKHATKPAAQSSLPVPPDPNAGALFSKPVAELEAEKAAKAKPAQTEAERAADLDALLGPDTLPHDDLAESALARAALRGNDAQTAPAKTLRDVWGEKMVAAYGKHAAAIEFARATGRKNWKAATDDGMDDAIIAKMLEDHLAANPATVDVPHEKPAEKAPARDETPIMATVPPETRNDAPTDVVAPVLSKITTLTGISAADISKRMNGRFPAAAYEPIPYGPMKGKTDLSFDYVRDRFDEVFGPHGLGWKLEPHAVMGKVEHIEVEEQRKDGGTRRVHMVAMEMFVFKYRVVMPDGSMEWIESSPLSDCDDNEDRGYAYRGAWTSLLKQTLRSFGGINHILRNEYTHVQAQRAQRAA
jgi:hypothetical protein